MAGEGSGSMADEPSAAEPTGPARLTVRITIEGEETAGQVQVLNAAGDVVDEGASGDTFAVPAGRYVLVGKVEDASILVDTPSKEADPIMIASGEERTEDIELGRAKVRLKVYKGRRQIRNVKVELRRPGSEEVVYEYEPTADHVAISPGRYDAVVHLPRNEQVEVTGIVFPAGSTRDIPIRIQ